MTIIEAVKKVLLAHGSPLTAKEIYCEIIKSNLYEFHTDKPVKIIQNEIWRHCEDIDLPSASLMKHFKRIDENKYYPLDEPKCIKINHIDQNTQQLSSIDRTNIANTLDEILFLQKHYISELKKKILIDLKKLSPTTFELFSKRLLDTYGFTETKVTQVSGDGGIDGHGKLKVGLAYLDIAFQCKRWTKGKIQRPDVDKFRGAIQGEFEQGLFFTTSSFSEGAVLASIKKGAVPIVLVDGAAIVDLMIEKSFGVQTEHLNIPTYVLDLALTNE